MQMRDLMIFDSRGMLLLSRTLRVASCCGRYLLVVRVLKWGAGWSQQEKPADLVGGISLDIKDQLLRNIIGYAR